MKTAIGHKVQETKLISVYLIAVKRTEGIYDDVTYQNGGTRRQYRR